jgi:hypothetical protein
LSGGERGLPLPLVRCDVSVRLYRKVHKDCTLSFEGSRYQVLHRLVGKRILIRFQQGVLRIFDGDRLVATHAQSPVKGRLVETPGLREAILADREMSARRHASPLKGKAKATPSPRPGTYARDVYHRRPQDGRREIAKGECCEGRQQRNYLCREVMVLSGLRGVSEWDWQPEAVATA